MLNKFRSFKNYIKMIKENNRLLLEIKENIGLNISYASENVVIDDYKYSPKYRESLLSSHFSKNIFEKLDMNEFIQLLEKMSVYKNKFMEIPIDFDEQNPTNPNWINGWIPPLDGVTIYSFLAMNNPRFYVECGSGNTTKFAAKSIRDNKLRTKIISIDPYPRAEIDQLCEHIYRIPFEDMDLEFFKSLTKEDIFVIDNSHRSFPNSDVTVFFTEVLPILPKDMLYALHDIFLPQDYPESWNQEKRYYNEQYLLAAYLLGGAGGDKIYFPSAYLSYLEISKNKMFEVFNADTNELPIINWGGFFWLRKG